MANNARQITDPTVHEPSAEFAVVSGPLHTRDWEPETIPLQAFSMVEKVEPVQIRLTLRSRDQRSMWMHDGCKVYTDFYMASDKSCFMVTSIIFKNHLLEVGLTQNHRETNALWILTIVNFFCFIMHEDPHDRNSLK